MNRRTTLRLAAFALASTASVQATDDGKAGKLDLDTFDKMNKEAGEKVAALKAGKGALSASDQALLTAVAAGGLAQLQASELALKHAKVEDVKAIAKAELAEQTILAAKLKEIARARGATLPKELDAAGKKLLELLKESEDSIDRPYLTESGVKGHQLLQATMEKVKDTAEDRSLKDLASITLPLIKAHLEVAREESATLA